MHKKYLYYLNTGTGTCVNLIGERIAGMLYLYKKLMYAVGAQRVLVPTQGIPCKLRPAGPLFSKHYTSQLKREVDMNRRMSDQALILEAISDVRDELKSASSNADNTSAEISEVLVRLANLYSLLDVKRIKVLVESADTRREAYRRAA